MQTWIEPWEYDREMYKGRNELERLFRRLNGYRRIVSRFEKLDIMSLGFISFVAVADGLRTCEQALVRCQLPTRGVVPPVQFVGWQKTVD